jgi:hypothetical protein
MLKSGAARCAERLLRRELFELGVRNRISPTARIIEVASISPQNEAFFQTPDSV